ncbi:MAG: Cna B-type domain-containing protein [Corynebacterium sp.]|nr:Cna B-type domain-containing protein [Corynebacterium sp.]
MHHKSISTRTWIAALIVVAVILAFTGFNAMPKAKAAEVQPTNVTFSLKDPNGNKPEKLKSYEPYMFTFGFAVPDGTRPGDTLRIVLPSQFDVVEHAVGSLGEGTTASTEKTADGTVVTVTFGEGISGLINLRGEFSLTANYAHTGEGESEVAVTVTLGNEKVYEQVLKGMGPPPAPPMAINKWSGYSTANTNIDTAKKLKLQTPTYNYQWIKPAGDQVFAHWFVELNNLHGESSPEEIGQDIVITDTLSGLPDGFVPVVEPSTPGALDQAQIDEQLEGNFLANFFSVAVRDAGTTTTYPKLNSLGQTRPYIVFAGNKFTFRVSDYLKSIGVTPSDSAQYAVNYYTLVPAVRANVTNVATVKTDRLPTEASDVGWYRSVTPDGWIYGEQPLTSLKVTKTWVGWDLAKGDTVPAVTFALYADGKPARYINDEKIPVKTLISGESVVEWKNLPTQNADRKPIVYSIKELEIKGVTPKVSNDYTPDLTDLKNIPPGEIRVTNTKKPPTTSSSTTTTSSKVTTTSTTPSEPTEPSTSATTSSSTTPTSSSSTTTMSSTTSSSSTTTSSKVTTTTSTTPSEPTEPSTSATTSSSTTPTTSSSTATTSSATTTSSTASSTTTSEPAPVPTTSTSESLPSVNDEPTPPSSPGSSTPRIPWWLIVPFIGVPLIAGSSSSGSSEPTPVVDRAEPVVSEENTSTPHEPVQKQEPGKPGQAKQRYLANTGANTMALLLVALVLFIVGGALLIRRRA